MSQQIEQRRYVMTLVQSFYQRIGNIMNAPHTLTEDEAIKLIEEVNKIIEEIDKMDDLQSGAALKTRFEVIKHELLKSMMTTPTDKKEG